MNGHHWIKDGVLLAMRNTDGWVTEMREPPYYQLDPCPYCDAPGRGPHDLTKHVDSHLHTTVMVTP